MRLIDADKLLSVMTDSDLLDKEDIEEYIKQTGVVEVEKRAVNKDKLKELDSHWREVMDLSLKYGFIILVGAGTAVLATHKNQIETFGEENYINRQRSMFKNNMEVDNGDNVPSLH